ncbi:hypothetical protein SuNHUV7_22390 (plasmid) [Pseudoseohaeicola sp. NH-UV-7]|uniref:hypothetical protein n=1 Tax=Sulfitobacter sp. TBRI5 TaxID=2989732 RepID=UPI003A738972
MTDKNHNEDRAEKLAGLLAPLVAKDIQHGIEKRLNELEQEVSTRLDGIASKNSELLDKLHRTKDAKQSLEDQLTGVVENQTRGDKLEEIVLDKVSALDPIAYRTAKAQAEKAGIPLRIDREAKHGTS